MEDKAKIKQSFQINKSYYSLIKHLNTEEKGIWIDAIFKHEVDGTKFSFGENKILQLAYDFVINELCENNKKYNIACEKKSKAKKKEWNNKTKKENTPQKEDKEEEDKSLFLTPDEIEKNKIIESNAEQKRLQGLLR